MCKAMEDMRNEARAEGRVEGRAEGRAEGSKEKAISAALLMIKDGALSYEKIAQYSGLTFDEIKALATKQPA